jgi:CAAX protease family protein
MNPFDKPSSGLPGESSAETPQPVAHETLGGDPLTATPVFQPSQSSPPLRSLPDDIRVPWSWVHLVLFVFFSFASLIVIQMGVALYLSAHHRLTQKALQEALESKPLLAVGTNVLWFGMILLFLYITLSVLPQSPFWRSLGWRRMPKHDGKLPSSPWIYFLTGCALAIFVALASAGIKNTDNIPIQQFLKSRSGAFLLMGMAVLIAPLVEETVFRGYLYPLFAKSFGILPAILLTGALFGLLHGAQLGWTWGLVALLTFVGIIFTFVRARTGTVLASFLLHLGYNSFIAASSIIATHGFTKVPLPH